MDSFSLALNSPQTKGVMNYSGSRMNSLYMSLMLQFPMMIVVIVGIVITLKRRGKYSYLFVGGATLHLVSAISAIPLAEIIAVTYGYSVKSVAYLTFSMSLIVSISFGLMFYAFNKSRNS